MVVKRKYFETGFKELNLHGPRPEPGGPQGQEVQGKTLYRNPYADSLLESRFQLKCLTFVDLLG
jgi:hypothetical protein